MVGQNIVKLHFVKPKVMIHIVKLKVKFQFQVIPFNWECGHCIEGEEHCSF